MPQHKLTVVCSLHIHPNNNLWNERDVLCTRTGSLTGLGQGDRHSCIFVQRDEDEWRVLSLWTWAGIVFVYGEEVSLSQPFRFMSDRATFVPSLSCVATFLEWSTDYAD